MSWKKRFNTVKIKNRNNSEGHRNNIANINNNKSWLPQFYQGSFDRISRYMQYDHMDYDIDINMALDTIAEFSTLADDYTGLPFELEISEELDSGDSEILKELLKKWCYLNEWDSRIFELFRNTLKYGDQIMVRDPETFKLLWIDCFNVTKVLVNEEEGRIPEYYFVKNLALNLTSLAATDESTFLMNVPLAGGARASRTVTNNQTLYSFRDDEYGRSGYDYNLDKEFPIDAKNILHVSRSNGMDVLWPFGRSILDAVFKPFKQKELMEDAIIIYRVQRSPERLIFKIDTGTMPPNKADRYLEEVATKFRQKRMPVIDSTKGETIMDTAYNPLAMTEDFFFAQGPDGRGSTVDQLPGGDSTGSIADLKFFTSRMIRGLRVPISYMSYLTEDGQSYTYNDGKLGAAYMEEFKFTKYCQRLQRQIIRSLNKEFKLFVKFKEVDINSSLFDIKFVEPQSFSEYRQIELDTAQMAVFQSVADVPYLSKRFIMKRFMGLTDEEILDNEKMWREERNIDIVVGSSSLNDGGISVPSDDEIDEMGEVEDQYGNEENQGNEEEYNFDNGEEEFPTGNNEQ